MSGGEPVSEPRTRLQKVMDCCKEDPCCPTSDQFKGEKKPDGLCSVPCRKTKLKQPLLDTETCFGVCEICGEEKCHAKYCSCCGERCLRRSRLSCKQQWCTLIFLIILPAYLILGGLLQFVMFHFATLKCGSGSPSDSYQFPGGGNSTYGGPSFNLVPRYSIIEEQPPRMWGMQFDMHESDRRATKGKLVGTWFRTWGPFFSTYTYQDIQHSQPTVYMRSSWQSMLFKYADDYIMRCDAKAHSIRISEGRMWFQNGIRNLFQVNTGSKLKVWRNGEQVAEAEETFHGGKSITFRNTSMADAQNADTEFATAYIIGQTSAGKDKWVVKIEEDKKKEGSLAFYQVQAMSVLYAFRVHNIKTKKAGTKQVLASAGSSQLRAADTSIQEKTIEEDEVRA